MLPPEPLAKLVMEAMVAAGEECELTDDAEPQASCCPHAQAEVDTRAQAIHTLVTTQAETRSRRARQTMR